MAKKRKKETEAEEMYEFVPPEFDEKQFLLDEIKTTKRVVLIVLYGMLFGVLAAVATAVTKNGYFGLMVFLLGVFLIKYFLITMQFDLSKFTKKTWAESALWFFVTSLAIWILVVNPPFMDYIAPDVKNVRLSVEVNQKFIVYNYSADTQTWQTAKNNISVTAALQSAYQNHSNVTIYAHVADSSGLSAAPMITLSPNSAPKAYSMLGGSNNSYSYAIAGMDLSFIDRGHYFTFSISAIDTLGNQATLTPADNAIKDVV